MASPYLRALGIGTVAGLRSMTAPAATARALDTAWAGPLGFLAAGEILADKLPFMPSRLSPPVLAERAVSGGWCGWALAKREGGAGAAGLVLGTAGALAGSWLGNSWRSFLTVGRGWPDFPGAAIEDGVTLLLARAATQRPL